MTQNGMSEQTDREMGELHGALEKVGLWAHNCTDVAFVKSEYVNADSPSGVLMMHPSMVPALIEVLKIANTAVPNLSKHIVANYKIGFERED